MTEHPLPLPPLDYISAGPYMVTFEWIRYATIHPFWVNTLPEALAVFYDGCRPIDEPGTCDRRIIIDGRGVVIHGYSEAEFAYPKVVTTAEVANMITALFPHLSDQCIMMEMEMLWLQD